jgi:EAL and modified HD-GYP domain-containing signal transduction protein
MQTVAYELLFRVGMKNSFPDVSPEYATSRMISDQFLCIPIPRIADNHSSFINVPHRMIISGLGDTLPNDKVVIEILEDAIPDDELSWRSGNFTTMAISWHLMISRWTAPGTGL